MTLAGAPRVPPLWARLILAAVLLALAVAFAIDHVAAVPGLAVLTAPLALLLSAALAVWGVLRLVRSVSAGGSQRRALLVGGIAMLMFAALTYFAWPKLALVLFGLVAAAAILLRR